MPELPEVETVARRLDASAAGARLQRVIVHDSAKLRLSGRRQLAGSELVKVSRAGKTVVLEFAGGAGRRLLQVHLRMSGRLYWIEQGKDLAAELGSFVNRVKGVCAKHCRLRLVFDRGTLLFVDPRRFGTAMLHSSEAELNIPGADPTLPGFTAAALGRLIGATKQPIKTWLMRQDRLTGLGNIYASEILFAARINPEREAGSLSPTELRALHRSIKTILRRAIANCGTTFSDFQSSEGAIGGYQRYLEVYGRAGEDCSSCGVEIRRLVQGQRSTFYCPSCQS